MRAPAPNHSGLVDRDRELAALRSMLDGLEGGQPGLLLFEGPAGIGKTRLLAEARRLAAERSVRVLSARGSALESAFAFGVVRQLFEAEVGDPARRDELLRGAAAGAGAVFDIADGDRAEGFAVLHGLYWLAVNLTTERPLVLAVDDAQWCDGASLRFLAYLVRRLAAVPVLVLATLRTGEQHDHEDLIAELALEPEALVVRPAPLSTEATAELVERRLGVRPASLFVTACERTTAGNPFLLCQLLQALAADGVRPDASHADRVVAVGSRAVSSRVLLQLRRLPPDVVVVARAASVLGDGAALPAVAALAGITEARTAEALAALARAEIVRDEQPVAFAHPLVRDAVYQALPAAERELCHERAASVLRDAQTSDELVAAHLLLAPPRGDENVVTLLRTAAREAAERGASESAVTYLRRALVESPTGSWRSDVVLELGHARSPARRRGRRRAPRAGVPTCTTTRASAARSPSRPPRPRCSPVRQESRRPSPARPRAALPDGLADQRQALIAHPAHQWVHAQHRRRLADTRSRSPKGRDRERGCWPPRSRWRRFWPAATGNGPSRWRVSRSTATT